MMEWITFVKSENVAKAEEALRKDFDLAAKQSITVKAASSLGIEAQGSFFHISGTDEGVKKCKELIKEFIEEIDEEKLEEAKKKIAEESESAAAGMGSIFG